MFSSSWAGLDIPDRVTTTSGRVCKKRKAQAGTPSSGRRALSRAALSSGRAASRPPRSGSITHTGIWYSASSATLPFASWKVQSR